MYIADDRPCARSRAATTSTQAGSAMQGSGEAWSPLPNYLQFLPMSFA